MACDNAIDLVSYADVQLIHCLMDFIYDMCDITGEVMFWTKKTNLQRVFILAWLCVQVSWANIQLTHGLVDCL
jgi:membrane-anchored glycerophosphoryl diester phosphodiesterase (GDPDase)